MAAVKVKLEELIRDSLNYSLEQIKVEQNDIKIIQDMISQNTRLIRKIDVAQDINGLSCIKEIQEELVNEGLILDIFFNENKHFCFTLNGEGNDISCESVQILEKCIKALLIGYKQRA